MRHLLRPPLNVILLLVLLAACAAPAERSGATVAAASTCEATVPAAAAPGATTDRGFAGWTAVLVAADDRASDGSRSPVFDNGREAVAAALAANGFRAERMLLYGPRCADQQGVGPVDPAVIAADLARAGASEGPGCLVFLTSHGEPRGAVFGRALLAPSGLERLVTAGCGDRPTIVIVSACYSGVFTGAAMARPNRLILTAARPDRPSFGCGAGDRFTFFDNCLVQAIEAGGTFLDVAATTRGCVAAREKALRFRPSEPQLVVGDAIAPLVQELILRPTRG